MADETPQETTSVFIETNKIMIPKGFKAPNAKKVSEIATSFNSEGQLQPIGVWITPAKDGTYTLAFGGHRLAAARQNHMTLIEAKVFPFVNAEEAEAATLAENLFRNQMSPADKAIAIAAWAAIYKKNHPETVHGGDRTKATKSKTPLERLAKTDPGTDGTGVVSEPIVTDSETSEKPEEVNAKPFAVAASEALGEHPRTIQKFERIGRILGAETIRLLELVNVTQKDQLALCGVKDEAVRNRAISLSVAGIPVEQAIKEAGEPIGIPGVARPAEEKEFTDEEWLNFFCGKMIAKLSDPTAYKKDALLYRHISELRNAFRRGASPKLALSKAQSRGGQFFGLISRVCNVAHPKHWMPCGYCNGTGSVTTEGRMAPCSKCFGAGYQVVVEGSR